jgi:hypothetical protein
MVFPDAAATEQAIDMLASGPFFKSAEEVGNRLAIGTPVQVAERLDLIASWGSRI